MNPLGKIWQFFKNSFFFLTVVTLLILGLYGAKLPIQIPEIAINNWQITAFPSGITFYQHQNKQKFYTISPLNDFYIDLNNKHIALLSTQDFVEEKFETNLNQPIINKIILGIKNYFFTPLISYNLKSDHVVNYAAIPHENNLLINKKIILSNQVQTIALGTTLNFYKNDYLFTPKGNLFTHKTENEINLFEQNFNFSLSSIKGNRHQIPEKQIIIHSPDLSGFILIQAFEGSFLWVDNESQLIEIYYPIQEQKKQYNNQFNIKIISTLENL